MSWMTSLRALALSAVLAAAPVLPSRPEPARPVAAESALDAMFSRAVSRPAATSSAFDAERLNAALAGVARLSYTEARADAATGATRLTGVTVEILGEKPVTLFTAGELLVWNADVDALAARLDGERLGETVRLFDRIELSGVAFSLTDYTEAVDKALAEALPEGRAGDLTNGESEMTVGRIVLNGLTLHPWTHKQVEGQEEGLAAIRLLSALARSFSLQSTVLLDASVSQSFADGADSGTFVTTYPRQLIEGYDRGDIASTIQTGTVLSAQLDLSPPDSSGVSKAVAAKPVEMTGSMGYGAWTGIRLNKLFEYGERGELPPISERDLWSLGTYTLQQTRLDLGGKPVFEIGRMDISADKFAWFLPERINIKHEDVAFDLAGLLRWAEEIEPAAPPPEGDLSLTQIIGIMERTGLAKLSGDGEFSLTWDSANGKALLVNRSVSDNLYTDNTRIEMRMPSYASLVPAFGKDGRTPDFAALSAQFDESFALVGGEYSLTDSGLLDALASLTIEIAKVSGEEDAMLASFADGTPETVRMFASGMLMFGSGAVTQELPEALPWITSLSAFLTKGGTFSVMIAPRKPLTLADFPGTEAEAGMSETPDAAEVVALLGLSMSHTPAAETAAGSP